MDAKHQIPLHPDEATAFHGEADYSNLRRLFIADSKEGNTATGMVYVAKSDAHLNGFMADQGFREGDTTIAYEYNHGKNRVRTGPERNGSPTTSLAPAWTRYLRRGTPTSISKR